MEPGAEVAEAQKEWRVLTPGGRGSTEPSQGSRRQKGAFACAEDFFGQTTGVRRGRSGYKDPFQAKMRGCYSFIELITVS